MSEDDYSPRQINADYGHNDGMENNTTSPAEEAAKPEEGPGKLVEATAKPAEEAAAAPSKEKTASAPAREEAAATLAKEEAAAVQSN